MIKLLTSLETSKLLFCCLLIKRQSLAVTEKQKKTPQNTQCKNHWKNLLIVSEVKLDVVFIVVDSVH